MAENDVDLNDRRVAYIAASGQTVFDIDFPIETVDDVAVYLDGVIVSPSNYTIDFDALTLTFASPVSAGASVIIEGDTSPIRETAYPQSGSFRSSLLNKDIRRLLYISQELLTKVSRSMTLAPDETSGILGILPKAETGKMLKWSASGLVNSTSNIDDLDDAVLAAQTAQYSAESAAASSSEDAAAVAADVALIDAALAALPLNNYAATTDPTVNDDETLGYSGNSKWLNTVSGDRFYCANPATGAAVWLVDSGLSADDLGDMAFETKANYALKTQGVQTGQIAIFSRKTAPSGYVRLNGLTIGNAASGATERANADTYDLFVLLWNEYANTELTIQDSSGVATTRGLSADDDWAANKRMPTEDWMTEAVFPRAWDGARTFGSYEADAFQGHRHAMNPGVNSGSSGGVLKSNTGSYTAYTTANTVTDGTNGTPRTADETRPKNRVGLFCIKL